HLLHPLLHVLVLPREAPARAEVGAHDPAVRMAELVASLGPPFRGAEDDRPMGRVESGHRRHRIPNAPGRTVAPEALPCRLLCSRAGWTERARRAVTSWSGPPPARPARSCRRPSGVAGATPNDRISS